MGKGGRKPLPLDKASSERITFNCTPAERSIIELWGGKTMSEDIRERLFPAEDISSEGQIEIANTKNRELDEIVANQAKEVRRLKNLMLKYKRAIKDLVMGNSVDDKTIKECMK